METLCCNNYQGPNKAYPDWNATKYRCCCGSCHVERAVFCLTMIGLISTIFGLAATHFDHRLLYGDLITFVTLFPVLYALYMREPGFYLPFLIVNGVAMVLFTVIYVFVAVNLIGHMQGTLAWAIIEQKNQTTIAGATSNDFLSVNNINETITTTTTTTKITRVPAQKEAMDEHHAETVVAATVMLFLILALVWALALWLYSLYWRYMRAEVAWLSSTVHPKIPVQETVQEIPTKRLNT